MNNTDSSLNSTSADSAAINTSSVNSSINEAFTETVATGEVENKINESNMLDSEDNYSSGFDFVEDGSSDIFVESDASASFNDNEPLSGEVESKVNESNMIDSEDNYNTGFDFISGNEDNEEEIPTILSGGNNGSLNNDDDDAVFVGDVEDKLNDSHLIGNDDDDDAGFNFL